MGTKPGGVHPKFGYLERDLETKKYKLGLRIIALANQILSSLDTREKAKPVLKKLVRELEMNVHLVILYEDEVLYLDREETVPSVVIPLVIGRRVPPHCKALGKILLAYDYEALDRILAKGPLPALTHNTITNP